MRSYALGYYRLVTADPDASNSWKLPVAFFDEDPADLNAMDDFQTTADSVSHHSISSLPALILILAQGKMVTAGQPSRESIERQLLSVAGYWLYEFSGLEFQGVAVPDGTSLVAVGRLRNSLLEHFGDVRIEQSIRACP